mmetsp:Transcript_92777/g.236013  ORF Transcript_92777/g.236013 Transcript_92777/m.236013 type:complete len:214 (-) Transcript_92777:8-649(-)
MDSKMVRSRVSSKPASAAPTAATVSTPEGSSAIRGRLPDGPTSVCMLSQFGCGPSGGGGWPAGTPFPAPAQALAVPYCAAGEGPPLLRMLLFAIWARSGSPGCILSKHWPFIKKSADWAFVPQSNIAKSVTPLALVTTFASAKPGMKRHKLSSSRGCASSGKPTTKTVLTSPAMSLALPAEGSSRQGMERKGGSPRGPPAPPSRRPRGARLAA